MGSFKFTLDPNRNLLYTQYFGVLEVEDFTACVAQGNAQYPGLDSIVDFTEASMVNISQQDIASLVQFATLHEPKNINAALVAAGHLEFGLVRMFDSRANTTLPQNRAVFRSLEEAEQWMDEQRKGVG